MSFIKIENLKSKEVVPGFHGRFVHGDQISLAYWDIKAGAEIPLHHHVHEMIVNVIKGKLELTIGDSTQILEEGMVGIIPSTIPHKAKGITDCFVIDVFYPVRDDYK